MAWPGLIARIDTVRFLPPNTQQAARMSNQPIAQWHDLVRHQNPGGLNALLADDVVFISPVVHTPQRGKPIAMAYLAAAFQVFFTPGFRYVREIVGASDAMLEFETEIDGVFVNGVDIIRWNDAGKIIEFKVMVRPLKALTAVHERMAAMLAAAKRPE